MPLNVTGAWSTLRTATAHLGDDWSLYLSLTCFFVLALVAIALVRKVLLVSLDCAWWISREALVWILIYAVGAHLVTQTIVRDFEPIVHLRALLKL